MAKKTMAEMPRMEPRADFHLDGKAQMPECVQFGKEVTLTVKGKVSAVRTDEYGTSFALTGFTVSADKGGKTRPM